VPVSALGWGIGIALAIGLAPAAADAKQTGLAYVSSEKDNAITMLDVKTHAVAGTIPTCKRPRHMQLMPDRERLLVVCSDSNRADLIDLKTRATVESIPLGDDPEVIDLSPDGKTIYVSNEDDAQLSVVDVASKKVVKTIKTGAEPEGVKVSRDGTIVYVASEVANMVHVIDTASGKVVKNVTVGNRPRRFMITPDDKELWVSNELAGSVSIIDRADHSVKEEIKFEAKGFRPNDITPVGMIMSADGKTAWIGLGRANHVAVVDVPSRKVKSLVLVGKRAWGVALNRDESLLFVANGLSDDVSVVETAGPKTLRSVKGGPRALRHRGGRLTMWTIPASGAERRPRWSLQSCRQSSHSVSALRFRRADVAIGYLAWEEDPRYEESRTVHEFPTHPTARPFKGAEVALEESAFALSAQGLEVSLDEVEAVDQAAATQALDAWAARGVSAVVLDVPGDWVKVLTAHLSSLGDKAPLLFNATAPDDDLRGASCHPQLFNVFPSQRMQSDALAQLLAARRWNRLLILQGPEAEDKQLGESFSQASRKFGLKVAATRPFKLSNDPRERDLGNIALLTANVDYDAVAGDRRGRGICARGSVSHRPAAARGGSQRGDGAGLASALRALRGAAVDQALPQGRRAPDVELGLVRLDGSQGDQPCHDGKT
jgi:PQQ-dependent catabolism-associated beta-propeller protein